MVDENLLRSLAQQYGGISSLARKARHSVFIGDVYLYWKGSLPPCSKDVVTPRIAAQLKAEAPALRRVCQGLTQQLRTLTVLVTRFLPQISAELQALAPGAIEDWFERGPTFIEKLEGDLEWVEVSAIRSALAVGADISDTSWVRARQPTLQAETSTLAYYEEEQIELLQYLDDRGDRRLPKQIAAQLRWHEDRVRDVAAGMADMPAPLIDWPRTPRGTRTRRGMVITNRGRSELARALQSRPVSTQIGPR